MSKNNNETESHNTRWVYTNDVLSAIVILSLCTVVIYSIINGIELNDMLLYSFILVNLAGATWLFGIDLIDKFNSK